MDRLITYKDRVWTSEDEVLYSDCKVNPGITVPGLEKNSRMKLMFTYHLDDETVEYFYEHYEPEEIHAMYEDIGPDMIISSFRRAGGKDDDWKTLSHENQVYYMLMCYDYYSDTFDMSEFNPSE